MLSRRLHLMLEGQFEQAGLERPRMYPWDRVHIARRALANANVEFGDDPRLLAARLGIPTCVGDARGCGGEMAAPTGVVVGSRLGRRWRGLLTWHGLAHVLLEGWDHSHADVWLLTGDLALPLRDCRLVEVDELVRRAHAPREFVERWLRVTSRLGQRGEEEAA
jgi:hypothetical protein